MKLELSADFAYPARKTVFSPNRYVRPTRGMNMPCVVAPVSCAVLPKPPICTSPVVGSNRFTPLPSGRVGQYCCSQRTPKASVMSRDTCQVSCIRRVGLHDDRVGI